MESKIPKVALLGDINIDVLLNIPSYPPPGGDVLVDTAELRTGGSVTNTAISLSRLGLHTDVIAHTGDDHWADIALETLRSEQVGVHFQVRDPRAGTGMIIVSVTPDGRRTMFSYRGANVLLAESEINAEIFSGVDWLHISGYSFLKSPQKEAAWRAVELADASHIPISLDLEAEPAGALGFDLEPLLGKLDLLVLGEAEALSIARLEKLDVSLDFLLACGVKTIGLKLGETGCLVVASGGRVRLPGFKVETIDTTGAGDAFSAALIFGGLRGLSLGARGVLANALGALATTVPGGGAALPPVEALKIFLRRQGKAVQPWDPWLDEAISSLENGL